MVMTLTRIQTMTLPGLFASSTLTLILFPFLLFSFFLFFLSLTPESATVYLPLPVWLRRAKMGLAVLIRALGYPCECDSAYVIVIT